MMDISIYSSLSIITSLGATQSTDYPIVITPVFIHMPMLSRWKTLEQNHQSSLLAGDRSEILTKLRVTITKLSPKNWKITSRVEESQHPLAICNLTVYPLLAKYEAHKPNHCEI